MRVGGGTVGQPFVHEARLSAQRVSWGTAEKPPSPNASSTTPPFVPNAAHPPCGLLPSISSKTKRPRRQHARTPARARYLTRYIIVLTAKDPLMRPIFPASWRVIVSHGSPAYGPYFTEHAKGKSNGEGRGRRTKGVETETLHTAQKTHLVRSCGFAGIPQDLPGSGRTCRDPAGLAGIPRNLIGASWALTGTRPEVRRYE